MEMHNQAERIGLNSRAVINAPITIPPETALQEWADKITEASGQAVEKIIAIGRLLLAAKKTLKHGRWGRMFKGHQQAVARPIRFSIARAKMFMKIAEHPILSNRNLGYCLPPSWSALYQLTFLPDPVLTRFIADGTITPQLRKAQVIALRYYLATPRLHRAPRKHAQDRLRWYADSINKLERDHAAIVTYWSQIDTDLRAPLRIGKDGRIQSGVWWLPSIPGGKIAPAAKPVYRCTCSTCGHVHADQRPTP